MKKLLLLLIFGLIQFMISAQNGFTTYTSNPTVMGALVKTTSMLVDNSGNKWIGLNVSGPTNAGLVKYDNSSWTLYSTTSTPALPSNSVTALAKDNAGNIWIGTDRGVVKFTGTNFVVFDMTDGLPSNTITCIEAVGSSVYVGTASGLSRYDGLNFTTYTMANGKLPNDNITCLKAENANLIWLGGVNRIVKFSINSTFTTTSYTDTPIASTPGKINCIYIDQQNTKWLGTTGKGVLMYSGTSFVNANSAYAIYGSAIPNNVYDIAEGLNNGVAFKMANNSVSLQSIGIIELAPNQKVYQYFYTTLNKQGDYIEKDGSTLVISAVPVTNNLFYYAFDKTNYTPQLGEVNVNNFKTLDINYVNAGIANRSDMHWNLTNLAGATPMYEVPKGSGKHSSFGAALWIGGLDNANQLHSAAQTYRQHGNDFWPGPLDTLTATTSSAVATAYDKIWKINNADITDFITNFNNGNVQNSTYTPSEDLLSWPAKGTGNYTRNMAPFEDVNHNGVYDPLTGGDYPAIKGDQALYYIFNDQVSVNSSSCTPMGLEIHGMAYAYGCPDNITENPVLGYTTFYDYKIINRSANAYHNVTISLWSDVDLGYYGDDYIGCNVTGNYGYAYNATNNDPTLGTTNGYGNYIPAQGFAILKGPLAPAGDGIDNNNDGTIDEAGEECKLNRFTYFRNSFAGVPTAQIEPQLCADYYGYMEGKWRDGTPFTCGGIGYGGSTPVNWIFSGDPTTTGVNTDPANTCGYWTELSAGNVPEDKRLMLNSGHFNLGAGQMTEIEYALVTSFDSTSATNSNILSVKKLKTDVQKVNLFYNLSNKSTCAMSTTGLKTYDLQNGFVIYPNPANALLNVKSDLPENTRIDYELVDVLGKTVLQSTGNTNFSISITDFAPGIYFLRLKAKGSLVVKKIVKE